jgi:hypothetical protein
MYRIDNGTITYHLFAFAQLMDAPINVTATYTKTPVRRYNSALNTAFHSQVECNERQGKGSQAGLKVNIFHLYSSPSYSTGLMIGGGVRLASN